MVGGGCGFGANRKARLKTRPLYSGSCDSSCVGGVTDELDFPFFEDFLAPFPSLSPLQPSAVVLELLVLLFFGYFVETPLSLSSRQSPKMECRS